MINFIGIELVFGQTSKNDIEAAILKVRDSLREYGAGSIMPEGYDELIGFWTSVKDNFKPSSDTSNAYLLIEPVKEVRDYTMMGALDDIALAVLDGMTEGTIDGVGPWQLIYT